VEESLGPDLALRRRVEQRISELGPVLDAHAGGVELLDVSQEGKVTLRFTGMCTGCQFRPLTVAGTLRPALLAVPGVTQVAAEGARISAEAEDRLAYYFSISGLSRLRLPTNSLPA
jgi:Fe-S cluster biogenesis protein NfuA